MPSPERRRLSWSFLGSLAYGKADELQRRLRERVRNSAGGDILVLLEHPHVFTLGRNADIGDILVDEDWLMSKGAQVHASDRGGRVTYHGPGQLVGYPIVDLSPNRRDLRRYVQDLQEVLVRTLDDLGVVARSRHQTEEIGVWVGDEKIASIGVHVSRWVTTHGFALNLTTDLSFFRGIVACGLPQVKMTSVEALTGESPGLEEVSLKVAAHFSQIFDRQSVQVDPNWILDLCPTDS